MRSREEKKRVPTDQQHLSGFVFVPEAVRDDVFRFRTIIDAVRDSAINDCDHIIGDDEHATGSVLVHVNRGSLYLIGTMTTITSEQASLAFFAETFTSGQRAER